MPTIEFHRNRDEWVLQKEEDLDSTAILHALSQSDSAVKETACQKNYNAKNLEKTNAEDKRRVVVDWARALWSMRVVR